MATCENFIIKLILIVKTSLLYLLIQRTYSLQIKAANCSFRKKCFIVHIKRNCKYAYVIYIFCLFLITNYLITSFNYF